MAQRERNSNYAINPTPEQALRSNRAILPARVIAALGGIGKPPACGPAHDGAEELLPLFEKTHSRGHVMNRLNFVELPTKDIAASQAFFGNVFGMQMTGYGPTYACTLSGDVDIGLQADAQEATEAPLPVIQVEDLELTLSAVIANGARVTKPIFSFPGGRRFHFIEPGGNELAAMQPDP